MRVTFENGDYLDGEEEEVGGGGEEEGRREGTLVRLSECGALTHGRWARDRMEGFAVVEEPM